MGAATAGMTSAVTAGMASAMTAGMATTMASTVGRHRIGRERERRRHCSDES
jgi:hypothetical protein